MKKIWIDLTDISIWTGHHTGTQRVVYQIAKRYHGLPGVNYFIFNPRHNTFHEHSFDEIMTRVEAAEQSTAEHTSSPRGGLVKHIATHAYRNLPEAVRKHATPHRRELMRRVYRTSKRIVKPGKMLVMDPTTPMIHFSREDTLLIMGKPWDYPNFAETLRKQKIKWGFKIIHVVYDLIPIFFPHLFGEPLFDPYARNMFETGALSDGLLAISESTSRDMKKFCKDMLISCPPIQVVRLGDDFSLVKSQKPETGVSEKEFILCVGTVEIRKNHQLLYTAYKLGLSKGLKLPKLVIVGGKGWYTNDLLYELTHDPAMDNLIYIVHHTSDKELKWFYENCLFTVYPSVYEGWGLPIAESLSYGKMCISSNTSSMTEIAGDLTEYFSPYDAAECLKLITKYYDSAALAKKEQEIGQAYKPVSWDETFKQITKFVDSL